MWGAEAHAKIIGAGMNDVITKPIRPSELTERLRAHLAAQVASPLATPAIADPRVPHFA
jgi:DNA-binding response OmpR family regulator